MDFHMESGLTCHVEMDVKGPNDGTAVKWTADALRRLADKIESGDFEDGHHPIKDGVGKEIGTVYFDSYELE